MTQHWSFRFIWMQWKINKKKTIIENNILFDENIRWLKINFAWNVLKHVQKAKYGETALFLFC